MLQSCMCFKLSFSVFLIAFVGLFSSLFGQKIQIELGPDEIAENQPWTITVTVNDERLKSYDNFPDIEGFRKRGTSTQSQTSIVNGQISSSQSVVMTYMATKQGVFTLPPFKMTINDQILSSQGKKITVGSPKQAQQRDPVRSLFERDPFDDFFGRGETEFVDIKEDALLALTTNKNEVYVGEGFTTTLSFLVADNNRAPMQFHDLGKQLSDILKKLRPSNCWEENFNIENIEGETIEINNKFYTQYKIYQATFYPLNTQPIVFPSVGLEMIKFRVAKNPSFFGQNRQEDFKTFYSSPKTIKVKELPPHPLKESVAVGSYRLDEKLGSLNLKTGQSASYEFNIYGEGNISSIEKPMVRKDNNFDFYEPNIKQSIKRENGRVAGAKAFSYYMIPKEPGDYDLGDYFSWVFFNPKSNKYDTLKSRYSITVTGESQKNISIDSKDSGSFYDRITLADNTIHSSIKNDWLKIGANLFILLMLGASAFFVFKK
ncbi:MAG TPA: BatD family protein [Cyclobacteriaceae bacterium]|nr:BatD family protein [Cyclobacteriaceae bacterium]HRK52299.1 BatD family protein [Cyclobacteriaceae bacterium]